MKGDTGDSIASIDRTSGSGLAGTQDVYTVYNSSGQAVGTFSVYQGANGTGAGDFMANGSVAMTGDLNVGGHRIKSVADPEEGSDDAISLGYFKREKEELEKEIANDTTPIIIRPMRRTYE